MLQQVEYRAKPFLAWVVSLMRQKLSLRQVMTRQKLVMTLRAKSMVALGYGTALIWIGLVGTLAVLTTSVGSQVWVLVAGALMYPLALLVVYASIATVMNITVVGPHEKRLMQLSRDTLASHSATRIVIAGSYGKTTMKELLVAVLAKKFKVAATPGNGNTPSAHAKFIQKLHGDEEILIFELGEGKPGDVLQFAQTLRPDFAIITGLAPNHLDQYKTIDALAEDILSLRKFVEPGKLFAAGDSALLLDHLEKDDIVFGEKGGPDWQNSDIHITATTTTFRLHAGENSIPITSSLLGRHQVGPLGFVVAYALAMGVDAEDVRQAIENIAPYEHRMQPYQLGGATIIDDTYNGNAEGIMAGLALLAEIDAARKVYVTPGLVDQGAETELVHRAIAAKIAETKPDWLVLMQNSATDIIRDELKKLGYSGHITVEQVPLEFYRNLDQFVKAGDVVLMQNDWTDNYR